MPWTLGSSSLVLKNCYSPANLVGRARMVQSPLTSLLSYSSPPLQGEGAPAKQEGEGRTGTATHATPAPCT